MREVRRIPHSRRERAAHSPRTRGDTQSLPLNRRLGWRCRTMRCNSLEQRSPEQTDRSRTRGPLNTHSHLRMGRPAPPPASVSPYTQNERSPERKPHRARTPRQVDGRVEDRQCRRPDLLSCSSSPRDIAAPLALRCREEHSTLLLSPGQPANILPPSRSYPLCSARGPLHYTVHLGHRPSAPPENTSYHSRMRHRPHCMECTSHHRGSPETRDHTHRDPGAHLDIQMSTPCSVLRKTKSQLPQ